MGAWAPIGAQAARMRGLLFGPLSGAGFGAGYDYGDMVPAWTDILLLALRASPT